MPTAILPAVRPRFTSVPITGATLPLAYTLTNINGEAQHHKQAKDIFIIFINGLGLPQTFWQPAISHLQQISRQQKLNARTTITLLTYDRQGQGLSQPPDAPPPDPHDILVSVEELRAMLQEYQPTPEATIFLVAHSIGVPLARLYIQRYPKTVTALLAIDSNMANSDFVSLFPDPNSPDFDPERDLPSDTSVEQLIETLAKYRAILHPSVPNPERLQRQNLASLLPCADRPDLQGTAKDGKICLAVVGHDPEAFAEEALKMSPKGLTRKYFEPVAQRYNQGLLRLGQSRQGKVMVAKGAGHFIQRDRPDFVAVEIWAMLLWLTEPA